MSIIATVDGTGRAHGFTAGSLTWLSSDPPLVTFCLSQRANCHSAFVDAEIFSVSLLALEHKSLAMRFARRGVDKFAGGEFHAVSGGCPVLADAVVTLQCNVRDRMTGGDHLFVVGQVVDHDINDAGLPMVMYRNHFTSMPFPA